LQKLCNQGKSALVADRLTPELIAEIDDSDVTGEWRSSLLAAGGVEGLLSGLEDLANLIGYEGLDADIESLYVELVRKLLREEDFYAARFWIVRGLGYYPQNGELRTLASDLQTDVRTIETENYVLSSSADGIVTQSVAGTLEGFRSFVLSEFSPFFDPGLAMRAMQKARVNLFRNSGQYEKSQDDRDGPKMRWGHYSRSSDAVCIYEINPEISGARGQQAPHLLRFGIIEVLQHELTHQILHRAYRRNLAPTWVTEGLAVVMTYAVRNGESGYRIPAGKNHASVSRAARKSDGPGRSLGDLMSLTRDQFLQDRQDENYTQAGAWCRFFLESVHFREPFLIYARDAYRGKLRGDLSVYLGTDIASLEESFEEYLR
jgi:hypothetical protein